MDMKIKMFGFLYVLVIIIELIKGQDDIKVDQQVNEASKQASEDSAGHTSAHFQTLSKNEDLKAPQQLESLKDIFGRRPVGLWWNKLKAVQQPGSPGSPIGQEQLKYSFVPSQSDSPYTTSFMADWPYGVVPYYIDGDAYDETLQRRIQKAMSIVESSSCVIFKEETEKPQGSNVSWLHFTNPNEQRECSHDTTKGDDGDIIIVLGIECLKSRDVLHSLLHGLGFKDEVSHPHRDQYIRILWENIQPRYRPLYRVRLDKAPYKLVEYDPMSIMHFHDRAYSENGGLTVAPVMPGLIIDPSDKLSQLDVMKLRIMFGQECNKRKVGDLIENCKNVIYNQSPHSEDEQQHSEENEDEHFFNEGEEDDNEINEENVDDEELTEGEEDDEQLNEGEEDDKQINAEEDEESDEQSNVEGKEESQLLSEGEDSKQQLKANDDEVDDKQELFARVTPKIEYLPLDGKEEEILRQGGLNPELPKNRTVIDGVREGRRDYPLHLWKYNMEKLH